VDGAIDSPARRPERRALGVRPERGPARPRCSTAPAASLCP